MAKRSYTQFVHEYGDRNGNTRYAVGEWDQERGQYYADLDATTAKLTGCSGQFANRPAGMDNYPTRKQALSRARYLFSHRYEEAPF